MRSDEGRVKPRLLLVEDDPGLVELLKWHLERAAFEVAQTPDGEEALMLAKEAPPDVILLDWMIEGVSGIEVCRRLRRTPGTAGVPIIMITGRDEESDRICGLETGADDYVTKPFSPRELLLRIKRLLRHRESNQDDREVIRINHLRIDIPKHLVTVQGRRIELTATEFKLLTLLAQRRGRVQSREQLLRDVWEYDSLIDTRTVDTHMRRLREKLGRAARYLDTVRGVGYRFLEE